MIGKNAIKAERYGSDHKGIFFRRELPQLEAAIDRCKDIYQPLGWQWAEQKKLFTAPNGATLKFRPLERDQDAEKYQGHDYTDLYFEELTNYPDPKPVNKLRGTLRSGAGVPVQFHATGNPGGPGHNWVKERYIDPAPQGYQVLRDDDGNERVFIPAKVSDNAALMAADPNYVRRLKLAGSAQLVKAWLEGDWNVIDGAFFDCWSQSMVLRPFEIPASWARFRSFDWGSARPFSCGWWAIAGDDFKAAEGFVIPRGAMIRYREWYGAKSANVGLKLTIDQVAAGIVERSPEKVAYSVADPAIFSEDGGPSISETMSKQPHRIIWRPADNKRIARHGHIGGWAEMRQRMIGFDDRPMIYCFNTCADSIRTIPVLQHDSTRAEDIDTSSEDHAADEWRYACMSRPWVPNVVSIDANKRDRYEDKWNDNDEGDWKTA